MLAPMSMEPWAANKKALIILFTGLEDHGLVMRGVFDVWLGFTCTESPMPALLNFQAFFFLVRTVFMIVNFYCFSKSRY